LRRCAADQTRDLGARALDRVAGAPPREMDARWVAVELLEHRGAHPRIQRRRRVVVEIDAVHAHRLTRAAAAAHDRRPVTDNAGPLLVRAGLITSEQLRAAYEALARAPGRTLVEQLVASGLVDEDRLCRFFHERLLVPIVGTVELARPSPRAVRLVPREMAL